MIYLIDPTVDALKPPCGAKSCSTYCGIKPLYGAPRA